MRTGEGLMVVKEAGVVARLRSALEPRAQEHTLGRIDITQEDFRSVFHEHGADPTLRLLATAVPLLSGDESRGIGLWLRERAAEGGDAGLRAAAACLLHIATLKEREIR